MDEDDDRPKEQDPHGSDQEEDSESDDDEFYWEADTRATITALIEAAELDPDSGTVALDHEDWDPKGRYSVRMFSSLEDLRRALIEIADSAMLSQVPWENGPVFNAESDDIVDAALDASGLPEFFGETRPPEDADVLVTLDDLCAPDSERTATLSLEEVNDLLIEELARNPELMHEVQARRLEELVAELFRRMGYAVTLTPPTRDGGRDVLAVRRDDVGTLLTLVECKRFSPDRKVGVGLVRALYGVVEYDRASHGVIATTSSFTRGASEFQKNLRYRLSLRDFDDLARWCKDYRARR